MPVNKEFAVGRKIGLDSLFSGNAMTVEIIEFRVHHAFACLNHYTGRRGRAEHGEGFILIFNGKINQLHQGAAIKLVDTWDSTCTVCLGKQGKCYNKRMQEVDLFALDVVNGYLSQFGYNILKINDVYQPNTDFTWLLREGFKNGNLREICVNASHGWNCNCAPGCMKTANGNFVNALFQKSVADCGQRNCIEPLLINRRQQQKQQLLLSRP